MQPKKLRPQLRAAVSSHEVQRSQSVASTASYDSLQAQDSPHEVNSGYLPATDRPQLQPLPLRQNTNDDSDATLRAMLNPPSSTHAFVEHMLHREELQSAAGVLGQQPQSGEAAHPYSVFDHTELPTNTYPPSEAHQYSSANTTTNGPQPTQVMSHAASLSNDMDKKDKKTPSTSAANEKELRELLEKNEGRSLESVARDVKTAERTAKSEKAKQLFAMRWLQEYCKQDKESVPRNRVYTHYAQRCGTDRVDTLNPASFGKLVRVIFPGIQTRRLGVRGESKYHYVNLTLKEDPHAMFSHRPSSAQLNREERQNSFEPEMSFNNISKLPADTAAFPQEQAMDRQPVVSDSNPHSKGRVFAEPNIIGIRHEGSTPQMYSQQLKFSTSDESMLQDEPMILPNVHQYVPPRTDNDVADALSALYRTHCTSLIDAVRFVKEKQFVRLLGSFNGTLTVPVSKLFAHPNMAPWIKACDWLMYQQIVRFVSQLALQVIPPQVFTMLGNVSAIITEHIKKNFHHYPAHVLQAKLEPATIFSSLLQRLLRVNETAHAAANLLMIDQNRDLMWQDWVKGVRPKRVVESELPNCGYEEVYHILTMEMRHLLEPLSPSSMIELGTEFQSAMDAAMAGDRTTPDLGNTTAEGVLDRWTVFLKSLPGRFPQASSRTLLHCISDVGTAAMRDITVNQAPSFGGWWVTKVWVDEMVHWLAEMGGFLDSQPFIAAESPNMSEAFNDSFDVASRAPSEDIHTGLGLNFGTSSSELRPADEGQRPPTSASNGHYHSLSSKANGQMSSLRFEYHQEQDHDDSGIGMSLVDTSLMDVKYDFPVSHDTVGNGVMVQ